MAVAPRQAAQPGQREGQRRGFHANELRRRKVPCQARQRAGQAAAQVDIAETRRQLAQQVAQLALGFTTGQVERHALGEGIPVQQQQQRECAQRQPAWHIDITQQRQARNEHQIDRQPPDRQPEPGPDQRRQTALRDGHKDETGTHTQHADQSEQQQPDHQQRQQLGQQRTQDGQASNDRSRHDRQSNG